MFEKYDSVVGIVVRRTVNGFYAKLETTDVIAFVKADCPLGTRVSLTVVDPRKGDFGKAIFCRLESVGACLDYAA